MVTEIKVGELCRVTTQPELQFVPLLNRVGFVESLDRGLASLALINIDGSPDGWPRLVPIACLAIETNPRWDRIKNNRKVENFDLSIKELAKQYRLLDSDILNIFNKLQSVSKNEG